MVINTKEISICVPSPRKKADTDGFTDGGFHKLHFMASPFEVIRLEVLSYVLLRQTLETLKGGSLFYHLFNKCSFVNTK